jgi:hypothetical protein
MGEERTLYGILVGKSYENRPLGRQWRRWEDGIRMETREIDWGKMDSVGSG